MQWIVKEATTVEEASDSTSDTGIDWETIIKKDAQTWRERGTEREERFWGEVGGKLI